MQTKPNGLNNPTLTSNVPHHSDDKLFLTYVEREGGDGMRKKKHNNE